MADVLLIQPPLSANELFTRGSKSSASVIPPLGLAYIAAVLMKHGHKCRIMDGIAESWTIDNISREAAKYDVVGITAVSTYVMRSIEVAAALKKSGLRAPIISGGPHSTVEPQSLLERNFDFTVIGEGEVTTLELVEKLAAGAIGSELRNVAGIAFIDNGEFVLTGARDKISPLDSIPLPARELLPMREYRSSIARSSRQPSHSMLASRGCPGVCSFCSKKTFGTKVRYFSPERIVEEFTVLKEKYGARDIAVWDDNFVSDAGIAHEVCDAIRRKKLDVTWSVEARVDGITREVVRDLKAAGCTYTALGIETGSERLLGYMNKKTNLDRVREAVRICKEEKMLVRGYFMIGLPTETRAEMEETIRFAMELDVEVVSFTLFVPLPGTLEYIRAAKSGTFDPDYFLKRIVPEFNFLDEPVYVPEGMTADELISIHKSAYKRYYFRPKVLIRKLLALRSPAELAALLKGGLTLIKDFLSGK